MSRWERNHSNRLQSEGGLVGPLSVHRRVRNYQGHCENLGNMDQTPVRNPPPPTPTTNANQEGVGENEVHNVPPLRSLRDYLQPAHAVTPSCVVLPPHGGNFDIKPGVIQLLPKFHGLDSDRPYLHLKEFEEVIATLHYPNVSEDTIRLKLFPFSLKERAKDWLHSLRPHSIGS